MQKPAPASGKPSAGAQKKSPVPAKKPAHSSSRKPAAGSARAKSASPSGFLLPEKWLRPAKLVLLDVLMIGIGLLIFAYFHHVRPSAYSTDDVITIARPTSQSAAQTPEPTQVPAATGELTAEAAQTPEPIPTATPDPSDWGAKFADQFSTDGVHATASNYRSENISISISHRSSKDEGDDPQVWFVADIYIRDIEMLQTAFARDVYGKGYKEWPHFMASAKGAVLAISGDYYGAREKGVVIRNGSVYRTDTFKDVCIIYYDGVMETMSAKEFDADAAIERGAYQAFSFGPALLDENGRVKESYDTEINDPNPRCAIGYYEPGHYCFVVADGRDFDYAEGLKMHELAQIFEDLGCKAAYNLDGGATATMVFRDSIVNKPYDGGRKVSDIIYIGEAAQ